MPTPAEKHNEWSVVGSFIATPDRPEGLLGAVEITVTSEDLVDADAKMVLKAIEIAQDGGWEPLPEVLQAIILRDNLDNWLGGELQVRHDSLLALIESIKSLGYNDPAAASSVAGAIRDTVNARRLMEYGQRAMTISANRGMTAQDRYAELAAQLEVVRPNAIEARIYDVEKQIEIMEQMRLKRAANVGQKLMTCPPEWWLQEYIPFLVPGLMYVVTAYTSYGKSSVMLQWAAHLARCGKRVIYFHAEDDIERQIDRVTRRITHATSRELASGDPRGQYAKVAKALRGIKEHLGGELLFCHCIGQPVSFIQSVCNNYKPDAIFVDYIQKLNNAPQMALVQGKADAALALIAERIKQIAENDKHMCVAVVGSQEVQHDGPSEFRKGTMGSRQIEHKAQVILEVERTRLTEADGPEVVNGITLANPGELSMFGRTVIHKNSDGPSGASTGVFFGPFFEYKALPYIAWEETHPDQMFPVPVLRLPDEAYYADQDAKAEAMLSIHKAMSDIRTRRSEARKNKFGGSREDKDLPF